MPELKLLLLQMLVIVGAARLLSAAFRFVGQPGVVGEMVAGLLLGPSFFGRLAPALMNNLFPEAGLGPLYALSQVGLVLFMFSVGLEVRPGLMRGSARSIILASQASILAPFVSGALLALLLYPRLGNGVPKLPFILFIGTALGITAFPVLARILADRKMMNTRAGLFAISCAAVDDVTAWCLLAVITVIARPEANQLGLPVRFTLLAAYLLIMLLVIRPAFRRLLPSTNAPSFGEFAGIMLLLIASSWTTETLAIHALFGAFLAGIVMPKGGPFEAGLKQRIESVTLALLLPLYFAYTGLRTSISLLNNAALWGFCGIIIAAAVASKLLVSAICIRATGLSWRESLTVGVLVNTRGLVELVVLSVGLDLHILSPTLFSMMVIMALLTTVMTSPVMDRLYPRAFSKN